MQPNVTEQKLKDLYNAVFEDEEDFCDRFFEKYYSPQNVLCAFDGDELCAALHILDVTLCDGDQLFSAGYIFAAATYPNYRSKGYMSRLLTEASERAKMQNKDFLFLILGEASLESYYSRFGFVSVSKNVETEIKPADIEVQSCPVQRAVDALNNVSGVHILRTKKNLEELLYTYGARLFMTDDGICAAYRAGNVAVIPKMTGNTDACAAACKALNAERALVTIFDPVMVLPLTSRARQKNEFSIDFMLG